MPTTETQYWAKELCEHPERESECHCWQHFDGDEWLMILKGQPQFEKYCHWQFVEEWNCPPGRHNWVTLLSAQPQFADKCKDWSIFSNSELITMIICQPQLAQFIYDKQWRALTAQDWAKLLVAQSQFKEQYDKFASVKVKREVALIMRD